MNWKSHVKTLVNQVGHALGRPEVLRLNPSERLAALSRIAADHADAYRGIHDNGLRVLLFNPIGYEFQTLVTAVVAHALALRGASVRVLICDSAVPQCERRTMDHDHGEVDCQQCMGINRTVFDALRVPTVSLSEFLTPADRSDVELLLASNPGERGWKLEVEGIPAGGMAYAGALRYFYASRLDPSDARQQEVGRQFLRASALIAKACPRILERLGPDRVIMVDGVYTYTGNYSRFFRAKGIPTYVWLRGYRKNTITICLGGNEGEILPELGEETWMASPLDEARNRELDDYLESRKTGAKDHRAFIEDPILDSRRLARELDLDPDRKTIGVFTNVAWDVAVLFKKSAFASADEWLVETVRTLAAMDVQAVIRVHPYEADAWNRTRQGAEQLLRSTFDPFPSNVRIISAQSKLSSYALMPMLCAGVVFSSKVGMELGCMSKPVLTGGLAFYRGKGFSIDPETADEYLAELRRLPDFGATPADWLRRARAFTHYYFFQRYIPIHALGDGERKLSIDRLADLSAGNDPALDGMCERIIAGEDCTYRSAAAAATEIGAL